MTTDDPGLVADIGATNARFALVLPDGTVSPPRVFALADHPTIAEAIETYLETECPLRKPVQAAIAIAAPVTGDQVTMTNHPWTFSIEGLRQRFGFRRIHVINDFAANALAILHLDKTDCRQIGPGSPALRQPIGVIGPGTGLGVSGLIPCGHGYVAIHGEGGHATIAPEDERESAVLDLLRRRYEHVSAERLLSGPGLVNLYHALCELSGIPAAPLTPMQITDARTGQENRLAVEATDMFGAMLGSVAGNLALLLGARGGIYIAGGIVPKLGGRLSPIPISPTL